MRMILAAPLLALALLSAANADGQVLMGVSAVRRQTPGCGVAGLDSHVTNIKGMFYRPEASVRAWLVGATVDTTVRAWLDRAEL